MRITIASLVLAIGLFGSARDAYADAPEPAPADETTARVPARPASSSERSRSNNALSPVAIAGAITFGLSYGPVFIVGATDTVLDCTIGLLFNQCEVNPLVIPVAGPFIYAATPAPKVSTGFSSIHEEKTLLVASGIVQAASIALMTVGLVTSGKRSSSPVGSLRPAPVLHGSTTGIALVGEF